MSGKELHEAFEALNPEEKAKIAACKDKDELIERAKAHGISLSEQQAQYGMNAFKAAKTLKPSGKEPVVHDELDGCGMPGWIECKRCKVGPMVYVEYGLFQCAKCGNYASIWGW